MTTKIAFPTRSGNGFKAFELYTFEQLNGCLYRITLENGAERVDSLDGKKSAHLWDGKNWDNAGHFIVLDNPNNYKQVIGIMAAYKLLLLGHRVWLSKNKEYGFFENKHGLAVSFGTDFGLITISGNYKPIKREHGRVIGTGFRCQGRFSLDEINAGLGQFSHAPFWATNRLPVKMSTPADHLLHYPTSGFIEVIL